MFIQKLTKSYSSSLPTYEPIPPYATSSPPSPSVPDHETGSFSCTYSPQHSLGVARLNLQSAQINEPEGWRAWFRRRPSTWVKVKVLGRTNIESGKGRGTGEGEEVKTWREERVVGKTEVVENTYTPNFGFKSYHALLGPYEHQLELEIFAKRRFSWLFPRGSKGKLMGTASFLFPPSVHAHTAILAPSKNGHEDAEWYEGSNEQEEEREHDHDFHERDHSPIPVTTMLAQTGSRASLASSRSHSRSRTVHEEVLEEERTEWAVQAALFKPDLSAVKGYLFFNVFWYPAIPAQVPLPTFRSREDVPTDDAGDNDRGGGGDPEGVNPIPHGRPQPGIVTFTLHSIHAVDVSANSHMEATVSLGWKSKPLHSCRALEGNLQSRQSSLSTSHRGEKPLPSRRERRDNGFGNQRDYGATSNEDEKQGDEVVTRFDSPFEFLCMDPTTTNVVVKVIEVTHHRGLIPKTTKEVVGHTSVSLLDLMQSQTPVTPVSAGGMFGDGRQGLSLNEQLFVRRETERRGRDRMLALLEHPTGKAKVCVEWRPLKVPEASHVKHVHE